MCITSFWGFWGFFWRTFCSFIVILLLKKKASLQHHPHVLAVAAGAAPSGLGWLMNTSRHHSQWSPARFWVSWEASRRPKPSPRFIGLTSNQAWLCCTRKINPSCKHKNLYIFYFLLPPVSCWLMGNFLWPECSQNICISAKKKKTLTSKSNVSQSLFLCHFHSPYRAINHIRCHKWI